MVSAELMYRNHVPHGCHAIPTAGLRFNGTQDLMHLLNHIRYLIEFDKRDKNDKDIANLEALKHSNHLQFLKASRRLRTLKIDNLWWFKKQVRLEVKDLKVKCDELKEILSDLSSEIEELEDDKYYSPYVLSKKFDKFLKDLGFECKRTTTDSSRLHYDLYESTCSDEELLQRALQMKDNLEQTQVVNKPQMQSVHIKDTRSEESEMSNI